MIVLLLSTHTYQHYYSAQIWVGNCPLSALCRVALTPLLMSYVQNTSLLSRYKLLKRSAPVLHPPKNVSLEVISKEITERNKKSRIARPRKSVPLGTNPTSEEKAEYVKKVLEHPEDIESCSSRKVFSRCPEDLSDEKVLEIFKRNAQSPWGWLENKDKFYFYKVDLPPDCVEQGNVLPLLPG